MDVPAVGTRLSHNGSFGTIKFTGEVAGTKGIWLGVEWDDATRGKHSGTKDGIQYFSCRVPNAGSFIRLSPSISYGRSFLNALKAKYIEAQHGTATQEKVVLGSSNGAIEVEVVNLDKIRGKFARVERLREISVDFEMVARADAPGDIRKTCPNVRGVDLSSNLLPSWDVIALIAAELPLLERLAVNRNRLALPSDISTFAVAFSALTTLQLNATLMTWTETEQVALAIPSLIDLECGYNNIKQLFSSTFASNANRAESNMEILNLDANELSDWAHVCETLAPYTKLDRLILASNHLQIIPDPTSDDVILSGLKSLACSTNNISTWDSIDALSRWCPALDTLSLNGNPISDVSISRQLMVAKMPSLLTLDASRISSRERTDCEVFYLSHIAKSADNDEARRRAHPRYDELCSKHGRPEDVLHQGQDKLIDKLIQINVHQCDVPLPSRDANPVAPKMVTLKILPTMSLRTFRLKIFKSLKAPEQTVAKTAVELWLKLRDGKYASMDNGQDTQELNWWGVEGGSDVYVYLRTKG